MIDVCANRAMGTESGLVICTPKPGVGLLAVAKSRRARPQVKLCSVGAMPKVACIFVASPKREADVRDLCVPCRLTVEAGPQGRR